MPSEWLWHLTRAAALVAYLCLWVAVVTGLVWDRLRHPLMGWIHPWAAAWAGYATVVHLAALRVDRYIGYTWRDLLVPLGGGLPPADIVGPHSRLLPRLATALAQGAGAYGDGPNQGALALGILSAYLLLGVLLTTWLKTRAWRALHLLAYPAWLLGLYHGIKAGTDSRAPWAVAFYTATALAVLVLTAWRLVRVGREA